MRGTSSRFCFKPQLAGVAAILLVFALTVASGGCSKASSAAHTSDPRLVPIDKMLSAQLPKGTVRTRVTFYLDSRGYKQIDAKGGTIVAVVHHIDTETLQPSTARVTFYFDSKDTLTSYDLEALPEGSYQP